MRFGRSSWRLVEGVARYAPTQKPFPCQGEYGVEMIRPSTSGVSIAYRVGAEAGLVLSALLSALAAILVGIPAIFPFPDLGKDLGVLFPAVVAVISTTIASLNFDNNWRSNRTARYRIDMLLLDLDKSDAKPDQIRDEMKRILQLRLDEFEKSD
jgi:hypothetical protein